MGKLDKEEISGFHLIFATFYESIPETRLLVEGFTGGSSLSTVVDGDIIDNPSDSATTQADSAAMPASSAFDNAAASSFDGSSANIPSPEIIAQPDVVSGLATETTPAPIESAADPIGGPAPAPVDGQVSAATPDPAPASTSDPTSAPVAPAPAPAAPAAQKKGKLPIFIGLGVVVVAAIITAVVLIFVAK